MKYISIKAVGARWNREHTLDVPRLVKRANLRESLEGPVEFRLRDIAHNNLAVLRDGLDRFRGQLDEVIMFDDEESRSTWLKFYGTGGREVVKRFPLIVVGLDQILDSAQYFVLVLRLHVNVNVVDASISKKKTYDVLVRQEVERASRESWVNGEDVEGKRRGSHLYADK
jgi:hypothetical protein